MKEKVRCSWAGSDPLYLAYHDEEWGVPQHDSRALWEMLMLEGFQAGLSWITILRKRDAFRKVFHNFDPVKVSRMTERDVERLLQNPEIIRSRAKIEATIGGAKAYLKMQQEGKTCRSLSGRWQAVSRSSTGPGRFRQKRLSPKRCRRRLRNADSSSLGR